MNAQQWNVRKISTYALAVSLWLATIGLSLEVIYACKEIFYLVQVRLGGSLARAQTNAPVLIFFLTLIDLAFIIITTEFHLKRVGEMESWKVFGWSLAVELSIILLYYIL